MKADFPPQRKESDLNGPIVPYGQRFDVRQEEPAARQPTVSRLGIVPVGHPCPKRQEGPKIVHGGQPAESTDQRRSASIEALNSLPFTL